MVSNIMMNDKTAIELAKAGREDGFKAIFENHATYLFTIAFKVLKQKEAAEDAVQSAFDTAFRHIGSFKGNSRLRTWLYTILVRTALKDKLKTNSLIEYNPDITGKIDSSFSKNEKAHDVAIILDLLSEKDRGILIMYYWDDLTVKEIAEILETNSNHVKILLFRARKKFQYYWKSNNSEGELSNEV